MKHQFDPITQCILRVDYWLNRMWKYKGRCSWLGLWHNAGEFSRDVYWEDEQ